MNQKTKFELKRCAPTLLTIAGVIGVFITGGLGIVAGMKAEKDAGGKDLSRKDFLKETWKCYVWTILSAILSSGCIIAGNRLSVKQIMALSTLAAAGTAKFNEYRDEVRKIVGKEKEEEIYEEVKNKINYSDWADNREFMDDIETFGIALEEPIKIYDDFSGEVHMISPTRVLLARYYLQKHYIEYGEASYNYFRELLGIPPHTVREYGYDGDDVGWNSYILKTEADTDIINIYIDDAPSWRTGGAEGSKIIRYEVFPQDGAISGALCEMPWD